MRCLCREQSGISAAHVAFEPHEVVDVGFEAASSMTFFVFLNLDVTTNNVAVNRGRLCGCINKLEEVSLPGSEA